MPTIAYINKRLSDKRMRLIRLANEIIEEYREQGVNLTLRQLYYQFVARRILPNGTNVYNTWYGNPGITCLSRLSLSDQKTYSKKPVEVLSLKDDGHRVIHDTLLIAVPNLSTEQAAQVFNGATIRDIPAQRVESADYRSQRSGSIREPARYGAAVRQTVVKALDTDGSDRHSSGSSTDR
jgi:hypothetical protein